MYDVLSANPKSDSRLAGRYITINDKDLTFSKKD